MTSCLLALIPENKNSHISQEKQSMAVLYPLSPVGYASLKEVLGALLPDTSASWLDVSCSVAPVALSSFTCPAFYPRWVSVPMQTLL